MPFIPLMILSGFRSLKRQTCKQHEGNLHCGVSEEFWLVDGVP